MKIQIWGQRKGLFHQSQTTRYLSDAVAPKENPFNTPMIHGETRFFANIDTGNSSAPVHFHF